VAYTLHLKILFSCTYYLSPAYRVCWACLGIAPSACLFIFFVSAISHRPILYTVVVYNPRIRVKGAKSCAKHIKGDNYLYRTEWVWGFLSWFDSQFYFCLYWFS